MLPDPDMTTHEPSSPFTPRSAVPGARADSSSTVATPSIEEQLRQLAVLRAQSPPMDMEAYLEDCRWLTKLWGQAEALDPYRGTHIAILNGEIVGTGVDHLKLQIDLARKLRVHPDQILIDYIF